MSPLVVIVAFAASIPLWFHPPKKTTVVLLDNGSTHNAVLVSSDTGDVLVDHPYSYTTLHDHNQNPALLQTGDPQTIRNQFSHELHALPPKPDSLLFYFDAGTSTLSEDSKNQLDTMLALIKQHEPAVIDIIGHSDRSGDAQLNDTLALERAQRVKAYLVDHNITLTHLSVVSHGENDPLIFTKDGVSEPRNRRVEVVIR